jgi:hypothetical protein
MRRGRSAMPKRRTYRMNEDQDDIRSNAAGLWRAVSPAVAPFPEGVIDVPSAIDGTAFFPGGLGVWLPKGGPLTDIATGQIMVVGQDFNSERLYRKALANKTEVGISVTWRELQKILSASGISESRCFFTNLYMGLRDGGCETGRFPGAKNKAFASRCVAFFSRQLKVVKPKLIMTLGVEPFRVLASKVFHLPKLTKLEACTEIYPSVPLAHGETTIIALTPPSSYSVNVRRRRYLGLSGMDAEEKMIADGLKVAFSN